VSFRYNRRLRFSEQNKIFAAQTPEIGLNVLMNNPKNLIAFLLLLLITFPAGTSGQTRKGSVRARRAKRTANARTKPKSAVLQPTSLATTTASGLTYMVTRPGTGQQLKAGDTVTVHYTGLLTSGVKFDSSLDRDQPFTFRLGAGMVIKGWDEGIARLRVGDQATLIIPPQLGYGERGAGGVIPPNATLIFIVEVVELKAGI
jgi:peptidylprolyl isomerase